MAGRSIVALCVGEPENDATLGQLSQFSWGTLSEFRRCLQAYIQYMILSRVGQLIWPRYICVQGMIINHVNLL